MVTSDLSSVPSQGGREMVTSDLSRVPSQGGRSLLHWKCVHVYFSKNVDNEGYLFLKSEKPVHVLTT